MVTVNLYNLALAEPLVLLGSAGPGIAAAWSPDGSQLGLHAWLSMSESSLLVTGLNSPQKIFKTILSRQGDGRRFVLPSEWHLLAHSLSPNPSGFLRLCCWRQVDIVQRTEGAFPVIIYVLRTPQPASSQQK